MEFKEMESILVALFERILLTSTGSTTRNIEAMLDGSIEVTIHEQCEVNREDLPEFIDQSIADESEKMIKRVTSLGYQDSVVSENLVYINRKFLSEEIYQELMTTTIPIGKTIANLETSRIIQETKIPYSAANRNFLGPISSHIPMKYYHIEHKGKVIFAIVEVFYIERILQLILSNKQRVYQTNLSSK